MTLLSLPPWVAAAAALTCAALYARFALIKCDYIVFVFAFCAALVVLHRFLPSSVWYWVRLGVAAGLVYFCVLEVMILKDSRTDRDPERKYLIVLGSTVRAGRPSLALLHRLEGALDYLTRYPNALAILSGGQGKDEAISEALCMWQWLTEKGIDPCRLIMEDSSATTMENLRFSFGIIRARGDAPEGNAAVLSSPYHLCRAKIMAKKLGVRAAGVRGKPGYPIYMLNYYIREAFGLTHLWVFGY